MIEIRLEDILATLDSWEREQKALKSKLGAIRILHQAAQPGLGLVCSECRRIWPCPTYTIVTKTEE